MKNINSSNTNSKPDPILGNGASQGSIKNASAGRVYPSTGPAVPNAKGSPLAPDKGLRVI